MVNQTSALLMVLVAMLSLSKGQSKTLVVTSILEPPFLFLKEFTSNGSQLSGNDRFEGYVADLLELVAKEAGFQYEIRLVPDGKFGEIVRNEGGITWNGMIGELIMKTADIAAGPLTISSKRSRVVDFGTPFMASGIGILVKKEAGSDWRTSPFFTQTFSTGVLACIAVSLIVVVILFYLISRFDPYERHSKTVKDDHNGGVMGALWLICGGLVLQGYAKRPTSFAAFILVISWWIFCLILFANFLSKMINMESGQATVRSQSSWTPEKLILDSNIKLLAINESNTASFLCSSQLYVYKKACEKLVFANSSAAGVEKVLSGGYAFFMETPWIKYTTQRYCELTSVDEILHQTFYGLATPLGSDNTRERLLLGVLELRESGQLAELERKWWRNAGSCKGNKKAKATAPLERSGPVTPLEIRNVFLFLIVGCILAAIAMSVEILYFRFKGQKPTADQVPPDSPDANDSQLPLQDTTEKNNDVTELA
ncbi:glutamate receptor 2-like [Lineus longissimus]|uniref:glutamate receptor 2-like n=1 Tax=Lineus longissimus TaxID=88925 RepID=UPI002B4EA4ED